MTANSPGRSSLDPNLASILESIRATVTSDSPPAPRKAADPGVDEPDSNREADADTVPDSIQAPPPASPAKPRGPTVEEFLAELIRPQVQAWLDSNLPEIVQDMARAEIARLTGSE